MPLAAGSGVYEEENCVRVTERKGRYKAFVRRTRTGSGKKRAGSRRLQSRGLGASGAAAMMNQAGLKGAPRLDTQAAGRILFLKALFWGFVREARQQAAVLAGAEFREGHVEQEPPAAGQALRVLGGKLWMPCLKSAARMRIIPGDKSTGGQGLKPVSASA